jgi:hypothetical protein
LSSSSELDEDEWDFVLRAQEARCAWLNAQG